MKTSPLGIRVAGDREEKKRMAFICSQHSAVKDPKYITLE